MNYRLGLKIGDSYIGWSMMDINDKNIPIKIIDQGIRVFSNGRELKVKKGLLGAPLAEERRIARGTRRNLERRTMRRVNTRKQLVKFGLLPIDEKEQFILDKVNPLKLRSDAITIQLEPYAIGRAIFHLQQKRGFKSNRKENTETGKVEELKDMKTGIFNLNKVLGDKYTLGQFLYKRFEKEICTKFRPNFAEKDLPIYDFYISREMVEKEFNAIWEAQKLYYPDLLTEAAYKAIYIAVFKQRPLKFPPKGKCRIIPHEDRISSAMPSVQRFRIIKEINTLRFTAPLSAIGQSLDTAQRKKLYNALLLKKHLTFKQINTIIERSSEYEFNLNCNKRDRLEGDTVSVLMRNKERFGDIWDSFSLEKQDSIMSILLHNDVTDPDYMDDETLENWLCTEYNLSSIQANKIVNTAFPSSVSAYGKTIISEILPQMIEYCIQDITAIKELGYVTHKHNDIKYNYYMPYYGEVLSEHINTTMPSSDPLVNKFGKIANPTIHIALNELRKLMNRLKDKHGKWPSGITLQIEPILRKSNKILLQSLKQKEESKKKYNRWRNEIERYKGQLAKKNDFLKMELWEELAEDPMQRKCILSGRSISMSMLFNDEVQIGYILPYSKTLDSSKSNLLLMDSKLAYMKGNRTPFEAFCDEEGDHAHNRILERTMNLPKTKQWRFRADALEIFTNKTLADEEEKGENTGLDIFAIKPLKDKSYVAKIFKKYLYHACLNKERDIYTTVGSFTPLLKHSWGMNDLLEMQHYDYRSHTIDAIILTLTTPYILKQISIAALLEETKGVKISRTIGNKKPFALFDWNKMQEHIRNLTVAHRPQEKLNPSDFCIGMGHEDTIYSYRGQKDNIIEVVIKKPLLDIKKREEIEKISWEKGRILLRDFIQNKNMEEGLKEFRATKEIDGKYNPLYKARSIQMKYDKSANIMVPIKYNANEEIIKIAQGGSNYRADIYIVDGSKKWQMEVIKTFDANRNSFVPSWKSEKQKIEIVMTLHLHDMIAYNADNIIHIMKVKKISGSQKRIYLVPHNLAKEKEEENQWGVSAAQLQQNNMRKVSVKVDGTLYDPGIFVSKI